MPEDVRRRIPRTDDVLADGRLADAARRLNRVTVKAAVTSAQQAARDGLLAPERVAEDAATRLAGSGACTLRPVLNATGVVLHTNLGRAPLAPQAIAALEAAAGYVDVEYDVVSGQRAARGRGALDALRAAVPDAGDVHLLGNGAAALVLAATALAANREIVVSRGEMVEIGDGFRLPDLLSCTGARLREVGTTNRTAYDDYAAAVGPDTGFVLKVHPSNFRMTGFTAAVPVRALADLGVPVVADIGSGLLRPDPLLADEPDAASVLREGAALVTASGDKLLGGPQAGLLLGQADLVARCRRHPLARALRVDKLTLAAFEATLRGRDDPAYEALHADESQLRRRADGLADTLRTARIDAEVVPSAGAVGGGGAPGLTLPGWAVAVHERYAAPLRAGSPCVVGRIADGRLLIDLRCVPAGRDSDVAAAVQAAAKRP
jgi:L-seryl-tRNA(Ser) seleniumtransferase